MSAKFELTAEPRTVQGKGASRRLRHTGRVPAILYGAGKPPLMVTLDHNTMMRHLANERFHTAILDVKVGNDSDQVILRDWQVHAGMLVTLSASSVFVLGVGALVAGFGTSWIFPTNVSRFYNIFGSDSTRRATPLFLCGTLGAAAATWLIGFLSNRYDDLRIGMFVLLVCVVLLIVLQTVLSFRKVEAGA